MKNEHEQISLIEVVN